MTARDPEHRGPSIALLADMLADKAEAFCRDFLPHGRKDGPRWRCGDVYGNAGQSLSIVLTGAKQGQWRDFSNPEHRGDLIDLLCKNQGIDKREAYKRACQWLGISRETWKPSVSRHAEARVTAQRERRARETEEVARKKIGWARDLWRRAKPATGTVAEAYFRARGISLEIPAAIGLIPLLRHKPSGRDLPCVVAAVVGPDAEAAKGYGIIAVHRTFLEIDGLTTGAGAKNFLFEHHVMDFGAQALRDPSCVAKVAGDHAKMMLGSPTGGCIPLTPRPTKSVLAFAEGIENGMAWAEKHPEASVRATYSASNMMNVAVPVAVRTLVFIKDGTSGFAKGPDGQPLLDADGQPYKPADETLRKAAQIQADIARDDGRQLDVKIWHADDGKDANDMLREGTL